MIGAPSAEGLHFSAFYYNRDTLSAHSLLEAAVDLFSLSGQLSCPDNSGPSVVVLGTS